MKRTFPAALRERMAETIEKYAYAIRGRSILHDSPEFIKATEAMNLLTATLRAATLKSMGRCGEPINKTIDIELIEQGPHVFVLYTGDAV
jgi:hypothetical protein